jgi:hypothetical protein
LGTNRLLASCTTRTLEVSRKTVPHSILEIDKSIVLDGLLLCLTNASSRTARRAREE